jgi:alkylation response protein AidB-like acyl-CoA dehydrogenase
LLNASIAKRLVRDLYTQVEEGIEQRSIGVSERVALKAQSAFIAEHCRRAVNEMAHYAGSSNFHLDSPIQRYFRDLNLLASHVFCEWDSSRELLGRDRLGLAPNHPIV